MTNAGSSKMSIEDMIGHYQRSIEKSENDPKRLLHCLSKLCRMNVTVQHLQATGIGRTVNQLRKDDGEVGVAAKALVSKWKEMVAAEESSECSEDDEEESVEDPDETSGNETERSPNEKQVEKAVYERRDSNSSDPQRIHSVSRDHHHHHKQHEYNYDSSMRSNVEDESRKSSSHRQQHQNGHQSHHSNTVNRETLPSRRHHSIDAVPTSSSSRSSRKHSDENVGINGNYDLDDVRASGGTSNDENERTEKDHSLSHSRSERNHKVKHHHGHESEHSSSRVDKVEREHHTKHSSHKSSSSSNITRDSSNRDKPSTSSKSDRHHGSSSKSETERKHGDRSKGSSSTSNHKRKFENDTNTSHGESSSQENGEMIAVKRHKSDTDTSSSSRREHKKSSKSSKQAPANDSIEIDHSMGTSFADALGMMMPSTSKSSGANSSLSNKVSSKSATTTSSHSSSKHKSSSGGSSSKSSSKSKDSGSKTMEHPTLPPPLLSPKAELPPLEDIAVDLPAPTITNDYKPKPLNPLIMDCVFKSQGGGNGAGTSKPMRMMTAEEALGANISSKKERMKVFSGGKANTTVLSLYEQCLRVIQRNIANLEYAWGIPFDILRPVLELATPEQLANVEHFNPQLMDDSDVLWKQHCARRFRSKQREEMETWRDMYFRCQNEQEERLNSLTNNIKLSQSVAVPVKQTKLAYIDSMVKPPRSVAKKQTQYGTERKLIATPAARTTALSSVAANIAKVGDIRLRTTAMMRDAAQVQSSNSGLKARKAPLMAKALQSMKSRFKR